MPKWVQDSEVMLCRLTITVVGPLGWLCDAMATAVMVGGTDSAQWIGQPELQGYQLFGVNRQEESAWEI